MSDRPELRFLIIPSFSVEEVVAIEKKDSSYFIVHHKMKKAFGIQKKTKSTLKLRKSLLKSQSLLWNCIEIYFLLP